MKGELFLFMVGYRFAPEVESYIRENYPQIDLVKSYTFDLEYNSLISYHKFLIPDRNVYFPGQEFLI